MCTLEKTYRALCEEISRHARLYYREFTPEISDQEYDALLRKLEEMERLHPELIAPFSPTQQVGSPMAEGESFAKVTHEVPLLSLSNTYNHKEVTDFFKRISDGLRAHYAEQVVNAMEAAGSALTKSERDRLIKEKRAEFAEAVQVVVEPKYDGISVELLYEEGRFVRASTRGDGVTGDDITANVRTIADVPSLLEAPYPDRLLVRGEIYMTYGTFEALNAAREVAGESLLMNPRNAAGGTLHLKDPAQVRARNLSCFVYDILTTHDEYTTHMEVLDALHHMGFALDYSPDIITLTTDYSEAVEAVIGRWDAKRAELPYPIDGLVLKVNSLDQRRRLGTNVKDPKWGFAFKFPSDALPTTLLDVELNVGRTGAVTPVAILAPVLLDGSRVSRASLHNFEYIEEKGLKIGDTVLVKKAGEIIPQVISVVHRGEDSREIPVPTACPQCDTPLVKRVISEKQNDNIVIVEYEKVLRCPAPLCPARLEQGLTYFVTRDNMNLDAVGEKLIAQLYAQGLVRTPADFYELTKESLLTLDRMGEKLAEKVLASIEKSRTTPFPKVISSLGIPGVGKSNARILAAFFTSPEALLALEGPWEPLEEQLKGLDGIGDVLAREVVTWLRDPAVRREISRLFTHLTMESVNETGSALAGKSFCVTGSLSRPRSEIHEIIERAGGRTVGSVSAKLDYLVCGEKAGSKRAKAEKQGVTVITEEELEALLSVPTVPEPPPVPKIEQPGLFD